MNDWLPCLLPHSQKVHAAPLWGAPALCRPDGPQPSWYSPHTKAIFAADDVCPACTALARAAADLDRIDEQVAGW